MTTATTKADARAVSVKLDNTMHVRIRNLAEARDRTPHYLMKAAIESYVEREEKQEAFRQAALAARREYEETGLHLTSAEANAWFDKLIAGEKVEPPPCHI
jgi:predicted transcriptional regulator